ncbi:hypothetical protein A3C91_01355 [Candidatus Azambacteria bacterium RIFCSPHIGHO2_02_FULL_52_12]|uniref:Uncharacterized protein n=1 Tax=Candidatus Azambacteria bacterium RIFCSPLOWO2_01_FULL_46_25 TaxID=1797298 RepID=A0A1F5BV84_9BACT|nr:MAG: hypothetical protein A3C91_01355 [Candidatus Azambacteria bacterium RIFCSPHIGHO2_02_FULL_52_12]OGD34535.1 MAG: hypothetical protein A2988_03415 [Candidatus Azambacteria bacterium RIFCSPLOWO2_01_FULL_46_25]OGD36409.1 MAG: hypothetical protein A2850_01915 [Candidatus Azambacteria bacterium RIFCSPHIGHO2_01_FULL_51_74]
MKKFRSENRNILLGGLALLIGTPIILTIAWILWTYPWTNILVYIALIYLEINYGSVFRSARAWWITKQKTKL